MRIALGLATVYRPAATKMISAFDFWRRSISSCGKLAATVVLLSSCEGEELAPAILDFESEELHAVKIDPCATHETGCPCDTEGELLECGSIQERRGDYLICKRGFRTCSDEMWSECLPETSSVE